MVEIKQIKVAGNLVGIIGFEETMASVQKEYADKDDVLSKILLKKFSRRNYIVPSARDAYARAFLREYKKFAGLPCEEDTEGDLDIKVLGPGCSACDTLMSLLMRILSELDLPADLTHVTDLKEIGSYGVLGTPALVINGQVRTVGKIPSAETLKNWLREVKGSS